ncbi:MAG: hypothetical protein ABI239_02830, partial [Aquihabitans sp.]
MNVSVDPAALDRYARSASRAGRLLRQAERRFMADIGGVGGPVEAPVWLLLSQVRCLADGEAATARWVRAVALAIRAADRPPSGIRAVVVDSCSTLAHVGHDPIATAAGLEVLLAADPSVAEVRAAASALGHKGLQGLIVNRPDLVGPVDGMPPWARYRANQLLAALLATASTDPVHRRALLMLLVPDERTGRPRQILL